MIASSEPRRFGSRPGDATAAVVSTVGTRTLRDGSEWAQGEEEDAVGDDGAGGNVVLLMLTAAAAVVTPRRCARRRPFTLSMFSSRCLAQRSAFISEA